MRQNVKERLNKKLSDNNMTTLADKSNIPPQLEQAPKRLYQNRTYDDSECANRLFDNRVNNNGINDGRLYGNGMYDDRRYDNYYTLQEPVYETRPTFLQSVTPGNEQLLIIFGFGFAAYALYLFFKSKDKS